MVQSEDNNPSCSLFHRGILGCLCIAEVLTLAAIATLYRAAGKPDTASFLWSRPGILFLCLMAGAVISLCGAAYQTLTVQKQDYGRIRRTVAVNVVAFVGVLILGEVVVRAFVTESLRGPVLAGVELRPYVWKEIAERFAKRINEEEQRNEQFFVFDSLLGWTVKPNSTGERGLFRSSAEGIRSPKVGIEYASTNPACRIALVGDSFVFGEESEFERTWGHQLELSLNNGCQVLNFGVPGYGIGQIYLRYNKDVASFHPDVVIVGFTDAVFRTLGVYGLLTFAPGYIPWSIPRFVLESQQPKLVNVPLIRPEAIYSTPSIEDLPHIRNAWNYAPNEWEMPGWRQLSRSYLFRTYVTFSPLWSQSRPEVSGDELRRVNAALFTKIRDDIRSNGSIPLFVYFPQKNNFEDSNYGSTATQEILRKNGFDYVDLTPCLKRIDSDRRFLMSGGHYTSEGESAVAQCLSPTVREYLTRADWQNGEQRRTSHLKALSAGAF